MDLKETDILGSEIDQHWYYDAKACAILKILGSRTPRKILDVGAGSGFFSRRLLGSTEANEAWCVDISYPEPRLEQENGKPIHFLRSIDTLDADLVLMMDVLEHVDDDVAMLQDYAAKVPNGATFLITVPAFQFLWSPHDLFLEHKRRYSLNQLEQTVSKAGLDTLTTVYYFGAVFPIAATLRLASRIFSPSVKAESQLKKHSHFINSTLKFLCAIERPVMHYNHLAGLSVCCLAKKTD